MPKARVETARHEVLLSEGERLTFGRSKTCTICLDPDDVTISRECGAVEFESGVWWVANNSHSRPLSVADAFGFRSVLPPRRQIAVLDTACVFVDGTRARHSLQIAIDPPLTHRLSGRHLSVEEPKEVSTATGSRVLISAADRLAMIALFAGYLEDPPRYDPHPKSYAAAASRLGWGRAKLLKRIEYRRLRLGAAGVPNMLGGFALTNLAEYAISRRLVTRDDLHVLRGGDER